MDELTLGRIVVVRALKGLGDFLCIVPALRALRRASPGSRITLLGLNSSTPLVTRFNRYLDELLPFPGFPGIPETAVDVTRLPAFFADAQSRQFDLAIQMHGNGGLTNPFTIMLGARANAGYYAPGAYCPDPKRFLALDESHHEVRRWLQLLAHLGIASKGEELEFPLQQGDWDALTALPEASSLLATNFVVLHAGASEPARRWSPEYFAVVGDHFARDGFRVVLTGSCDELDVAAEVAGRMRYAAVNISGRTNLGAMAALLRRARLLVSNDTGVSHLAAALSVPSVIVFLASDPSRWAPLNTTLHRAAGRPGWAGGPGPDRVLREAYDLLQHPLATRQPAEVIVAKGASTEAVPAAAASSEVAHA